VANRFQIDFDKSSPKTLPVPPGRRRSLPNHQKKTSRRSSRSLRNLAVFIALIGLLALSGGLLAGGSALAESTIARTSDGSLGSPEPDRTRTPQTLIVWAGDAAHKAPDFIAVVDFDPNSPTYGKVLSTVPIPGPGGIGNEPHHVGLSSDGKTLALGGLLSVLRDQDQIFFFDVSDPRDPVFLSSNNPPHASIADEIDGLDHGGFLATFMGSPDGANPGRLVEYDSSENFVQAWPLDPPNDGFDPHGLSIDEKHNLILTSDFICPLHTLYVPGGGKVILRGSVRVWDFKKRSIIRKITVGAPGSPAGTIDVALIPHDPKLRAYTAGMADNKLYLIDPRRGTATPVFDFSSFTVSSFPIWPQLFRINRAATRLFITLNYDGQAGKVVQLNIANPEHPRFLSSVDLGLGSGPHYLALTKDEKRLVVSDYFLKEDLVPGGVVQADGDHKVHVIKVEANSIALDPHFDLDFNRDISTGPARPHGLVVFPPHND